MCILSAWGARGTRINRIKPVKRFGGAFSRCLNALTALASIVAWRGLREILPY